MTANTIVRTATAIADPNDPTNTFSPSYTNVVVVGLTQTQTFTPPLKAIYCGTSANVKVDMAGTGTGITFIGVAKGQWLAIRVNKIYTTGTTVQRLIGAY